MTNQLDKIVYDFLRMQDIRVARTYLTNQLSSHPEPNSLLSITDTLDELGIVYSAVRIEKDQLPQIPRPFLAHIRRSNGQFVLIKKTDDPDPQQAKGTPTPGSWTDTWTGVILAVEKTVAIRNLDNTRMLNQERRNRTLTTAFILSGLVFFIYPLLQFTTAISLLTVLSLLGLSLSILIFQKEAGVQNALIDQLCNTEKTSDCNTVLESKASHLLSWIKLSDLGLIYFSGQLLALHSSRSILTQIDSIFALLAACSLPLTLYSLYYQGIVLRKWCTLCLSIVAVLWLQFLVLFPSLNSLTLTGSQVGPASGLLAAFVGTGSGWILLKQTILGKADLKKQLLRAWRLKRDPQVFANLVQGRRRIDDTPFEGEIQLGSAKKPIRLLAVFNPYCKPCASEYRQLEELLANNNDWLSLTIRFTVKLDGKDKRTDAVRYLLQYWKANEERFKKEQAPTAWRELLHSWFEGMNLDSFKATHPLEIFPNVEPILQLHDGWTSANKIYSTPSLFLNGYEFPRQYTVQDLSLLRPVIGESIAIFQKQN